MNHHVYINQTDVWETTMSCTKEVRPKWVGCHIHSEIPPVFLSCSLPLCRMSSPKNKGKTKTPKSKLKVDTSLRVGSPVHDIFIHDWMTGIFSCDDLGKLHLVEK